MGVNLEFLLTMGNEYFNILLRIDNRCKDFPSLVYNRAPLSFNFIFSYITLFFIFTFFIIARAFRNFSSIQSIVILHSNVDFGYF